MTFVVGNNNACGRCGTRHGGTDHTCPAHGLVARGCCAAPCDPAAWVWIQRVGVRSADTPIPAGYVRRDHGSRTACWWER